MKTHFTKYQALGNDFLIIEGARPPVKRPIGRLAKAICDRRTGVGADGLLYISRSRRADIRADVFNADGSWAEKSGNGVRMAALELKAKEPRSSAFTIEMGGTLNQVRLLRKIPAGSIIQAEIGRPDFRTEAVPMKSRFSYHIGRELKVGRQIIRATCLSVGNPHCVVAVENFDFDWHSLGRAIESSKIFPQATNVEFVQVVNSHKIRVAEWERGAGATGSSGTGAAAAVAAMVIQGFTARTCEVVFDLGSLNVEWKADTDTLVLSGPVVKVATGEYDYR